jgi:hypothetical protein
MMEITQVVYFNHELDLLEANIVEAQEYAQRIIVKEAARDWNGNPKPLHATENWDRYKKYPKVEVMIIPDDQYPIARDKAAQRINENITRSYGWKEVSRGAQYVVSCDVDEIIDSRKWDMIEHHLKPGNLLHLGICYDVFNWYMNHQRRNPNKLYRIFKTGEPEIVLYPKGRVRHQMAPEEIIGWHFSTCYEYEGWEKKFTSMPYLYGLTPEKLAEVDWAWCRENLKVPISDGKFRRQRGDTSPKVSLDYYPKFVRENHYLFPWRAPVEFV